MADKDISDPFLDALFDEARDADTASPDLMARVLADAEAVQDAAMAAAVEAAPKVPVWRAVLDAIGGWPAAAGLATAGLAGVWIGVTPPDVLSYEVAMVLGTDTTLDVFGLGDTAGLFDGTALEGLEGEGG